MAIKQFTKVSASFFVRTHSPVAKPVKQSDIPDKSSAAPTPLSFSNPHIFLQRSGSCCCQGNLVREKNCWISKNCSTQSWTCWKASPATVRLSKYASSFSPPAILFVFIRVKRCRGCHVTRCVRCWVGYGGLAGWFESNPSFFTMLRPTPPSPKHLNYQQNERRKPLYDQFAKLIWRLSKLRQFILTCADQV